MSDSQPIRILIADDHHIVRRGIRDLLDTEPDMTIVGEASNGEEAVTAVANLNPDVVLMDLVMPGTDGIEATRQIKAAQPQMKILVLTSFATDGDDGTSGVAGATVTGETVQDRETAVTFLDNNDSYTFFKQLDAAGRGQHLIKTGPTGTNVNDLIIILNYVRE